MQRAETDGVCGIVRLRKGATCVVLTGSAGSGKSAFAARTFLEMPAMEAAVFLQPDDAHSADSECLGMDVAFQLAVRHNAHRRALMEVVKAERSTLSRSAGSALECYVGALADALLDDETSEILVLVEGIDQVTGQQGETPCNRAAQEIARLAANLAWPSFVRFVMTARPDSAIEEAFAAFPCVRIDVHPEECRADVKAFVALLVPDDGQSARIVAGAIGMNH